MMWQRLHPAYYLRRCAQMLAGSQVKASTPSAFRTAATHGRQSGRSGAGAGRRRQELDMVVNISAVLSGDWRYVRDDLAAVIAVTTPRDKK